MKRPQLKRPVFSRGLAMILCAALLGTYVPDVRAEDRSGTAAPVDSAAQARWKAELEEAKATRTTLFVLGGLGLVAGTAFIANGISDKNAAENTDGCSSSGSQVYCGNQQQADEAQAKIDSGDKKIAIGAIVVGVGTLFAIFGLKKNGHVSMLERKGRRKGFAWNIDMEKQDEVTTRLNYVF